VYGSTRSESRTFRYASRMPARRSACLAATTYNAGIRSYVRERSRRPAWAKPRLAATTSTLTHRSTHSENDRGPSHGDQPVWPRRPTTPGPTTHVSAPSVPRTTTNPRMGEALFGRQELVADAPLHRFRRRSRTHPWAKPCLAGDDLQPACRSARSESDCEPTHGRSPVWRADPRCSYERNFPRRTLRVAARLGWSFLITP
jgi:hypothetical protein